MYNIYILGNYVTIDPCSMFLLKIYHKNYLIFIPIFINMVTEHETVKPT